MNLINDDRNFLSIFQYIINCTFCSSNKSGGNMSSNSKNSLHTPNSLNTQIVAQGGQQSKITPSTQYTEQNYYKLNHNTKIPTLQKSTKFEKQEESNSSGTNGSQSTPKGMLF